MGGASFALALVLPQRTKKNKKTWCRHGTRFALPPTHPFPTSPLLRIAELATICGPHGGSRHQGLAAACQRRRTALFLPYRQPTLHDRRPPRSARPLPTRPARALRVLQGKNSPRWNPRRSCSARWPTSTTCPACPAWWVSRSPLPSWQSMRQHPDMHTDSMHCAKRPRRTALAHTVVMPTLLGLSSPRPDVRLTPNARAFCT